MSVNDSIWGCQLAIRDWYSLLVSQRATIERTNDTGSFQIFEHFDKVIGSSRLFLQYMYEGVIETKKQTDSMRTRTFQTASARDSRMMTSSWWKNAELRAISNSSSTSCQFFLLLALLARICAKCVSLTMTILFRSLQSRMMALATLRHSSVASDSISVSAIRMARFQFSKLA